MKVRFLLFAVLAVFSLFSCEKETLEPDNIGGNENKTEYSLKAEPTVLSFPATGATPQEIKIESANVAWTADITGENTDWLSITTGENTVSVTVTDNTSSDPRSCNIVIRPDVADIDTVYIAVQQDGLAAPVVQKLRPEGLITYYGDSYVYSTNGYGEWVLNMFTEDTDVTLEWVNFGKSGYWRETVSNGREISLYMYCDLSEDFFNPVMNSGSYTPCQQSEIDNMTFTLTSGDHSNTWPSGSYVLDCENGKNTFLYITDGSVDVNRDGDTYHVSMSLVLEDGTQLDYEYSGQMNLSLLGTPPYYSDLKEDATIGGNDFTKVIASSYACDDETYTKWVVQLMGDNVSLDEMGSPIGKGYFGNLEMISLTADGTDAIPEGTYEVGYYMFYDPVEFEALAGSYNPITGNTGCYLEQLSDGNKGYVYMPVVGGTITVTHIDGDKYRFEVAGEDDNYHKINATYEGVVSIEKSQY